MVSRLVLGSGLLGTPVLASLGERPGRVAVALGDESRTEMLREEGVAATTVDLADPSALAALEHPDVVLVACEDDAATRSATRAAATAFPTATLIAFAVDGSGDSAELAPVADRVLDGPTVVADRILAHAGDDGTKVRQLRRVLRDCERLAVVTHDNPDPDAIASGFALARIAEDCGAQAEVCYFGDISHQENRAFINLLDLDLRNLDPGADLSAFDAIALVDHSRPGVNDGLDEGRDVDVVIDHHPPRAPVDARFVDLRSEVGATSTMLVDYLEGYDRLIDESVATALLFGIRIDTNEFTREVTPMDFAAAADLIPVADLGLLERIESPSISPETFGTIADAIGNREQRDDVLLSCVGRANDRDALSQAADRLLTMEGVGVTVVYGVMDGTIYVSARSRRSDVDLGEVLREAFGQIGSAGGHANMAGAQIALGVLESVEDCDESLVEVVESVITDRFFEALSIHADSSFTGAFDAEFAASDEFIVPPESRDESATDVEPGLASDREE